MASTSLGEVPVPLHRRMGATPPEAGGVEVMAAETSAPLVGMLLFSQPIMPSSPRMHPAGCSPIQLAGRLTWTTSLTAR
jgi:hypothetical protein